MNKLRHNIGEEDVEIQVGDTVLVFKLASVLLYLLDRPGVIGLPYPAFDIGLFWSGYSIICRRDCAAQPARPAPAPLNSWSLFFDFKSLCAPPCDRQVRNAATTPSKPARPFGHDRRHTLACTSHFFRQHTHKF